MATNPPGSASKTVKQTLTPEQKAVAEKIAKLQRIPGDVAQRFVLVKGKLAGTAFNKGK